MKKITKHPLLLKHETIRCLSGARMLDVAGGSHTIAPPSRTSESQCVKCTWVWCQ